MNEETRDRLLDAARGSEDAIEVEATPSRWAEGRELLYELTRRLSALNEVLLLGGPFGTSLVIHSAFRDTAFKTERIVQRQGRMGEENEEDEGEEDDDKPWGQDDHRIADYLPAINSCLNKLRNFAGVNLVFISSGEILIDRVLFDSFDSCD